MRSISILALCASCHSSALASTTVGGVTPYTDGPATTGWAVQSAIGVGEGTGNIGQGMHLGLRRAGSTQELALGVHIYSISPWGKRNPAGGAFVRAGVNLLEWDRVGADDGLGVLGPSLEVGVGALFGLCVIASVARDFRFNDRDDTFLGISAGVCSVFPATR